MINARFTHFIAAVTIILLLIFSVYLLLNKKHKLKHVLLAVFFIANMFYLIDYMLIPIEEFFGISLKWFDDVGLSFGFLFGPVIWFFIHSVTNNNYKLKEMYLWHFIPFALFFITYSIGNNWLCNFGYIILFIHLFAYYFLSLYHLKIYIAKVKTFFSTLEKKNYAWVVYVLVAFIVVTFIDFTSAILAFFHWDNPTTRAYLNFFSVIINFLFIVYVFYKSIRLPELSNIESEIIVVEKYSNSKLTNETKKEILKKTEDYFSSEKPYLNPSLTISDVSKAIDVPIKSISQVINEFLNKNFYDFTNSYRIEEAKTHLADFEDEKITVLEILYKSGFNSKSSFNTAFKKYTSTTPTQYRNRIKASKT